MAMKIFCSNPVGLRAAIKKAIEQKKIRTWACNSKFEFDHTPPDWTGKAKLRVEVANSGTYLYCSARYPDGATAFGNDHAYAVFQGRFVEMLMQHFRSDFEFIATGLEPNLTKVGVKVAKAL